MKFATRERKDGKAMANHEQEVSVDTGMSDADVFAAAFGGGNDASSKSADNGVPSVESGTPGEGSAAEPAEAVTQSGRERDEFGRFKSKASDAQEQPEEAEPQTQVEAPAEAAAQEPEAVTPPKEDDDGKIPSWRMREIREARDAERNARLAAEQKAAALETQSQQAFAAIQHLQQQLHALQNPQRPQQPQTPPNMFEDPDGFTGHWDQRLSAIENGLKGEFQREIRKVRLESNLATTAHLYKEEFPEALQAFEQAAVNDQALKHRVFGSADPGGAIVAWHKERKALHEIGGDPTSYVQRKLDEALKDPAFLAKALEAARAQAGGQAVAPATQGQSAARPNTIVKRPPSLSGVPGGASAHAGVANGSGDSDRDLFNKSLFGR